MYPYKITAFTVIQPFQKKRPNEIFGRTWRRHKRTRTKVECKERNTAICYLLWLVFDWLNTRFSVNETMMLWQKSHVNHFIELWMTANFILFVLYSKSTQFQHFSQFSKDLCLYSMRIVNTSKHRFIQVNLKSQPRTTHFIQYTR